LKLEEAYLKLWYHHRKPWVHHTLPPDPLPAGRGRKTLKLPPLEGRAGVGCTKSLIFILKRGSVEEYNHDS
jgi:hypothetical protein